MKRLVPVFAMVAALMAACYMAAGCAQAPAGPSGTVDGALKAITTHDYESLKNYYAGDIEKLTGDLTELSGANSMGIDADDVKLTDEQTKQIEAGINKLLEFDYRLGEEKVDGDSATVNVTFTNYDVGKVATALLEDVMPTAMSAAMGGNSDQSAMIGAVVESMTKALGDLGEKNVTKDAYVNLVKDADGNWKIADLENADEEYIKQLANGMFGGAVDTVTEWAEQLMGSLGGMDTDSLGDLMQDAG